MRFFVETYGCTMNQGEGQEMQQKLVSMGHIIAESADEAEIVVVNTCIVIRSTELKIRKRMRRLQEEGKQLIVTGCMASVQGREVLSEFPDVILLPPSNYVSFSETVVERFGMGDSNRVLPISGATFILPIAQGCLGHCSYCITRLARGSLKSYPLPELTRLAEKAAKDGARRSS